MIHIEKNTLTAPQFHTLYTAVGWDAPEICQIERALAHSVAVFQPMTMRIRHVRSGWCGFWEMAECPSI